ncbi:MAG: Stringent starvation protein B [Methylacidiphilales bacterium]|nr:Stringent starvation protein B [Candidatus Methylacidiphilales bacterium]
MTVDHIRYDLLAQDALRGVVRRVLQDVMRDGLPGEHHFYIAFDTRAPGVRLSPRLLERYPEEMTIILQHQFWDLSVSDYGFEVGLSFAGIPERLFVPFSALKGFFDPSVQFGLQFEVVDEHAATEPDTTGADAAAQRPAIAEMSEGKPRGSVPATGAPPAHPIARETAEGPADTDQDGKSDTGKSSTGKSSADKPEDAQPEGGATIVRLDTFRKK